MRREVGDPEPVDVAEGTADSEELVRVGRKGKRILQRIRRARVTKSAKNPRSCVPDFQVRIVESRDADGHAHGSRVTQRGERRGADLDGRVAARVDERAGDLRGGALSAAQFAGRNGAGSRRFQGEIGHQMLVAPARSHPEPEDLEVRQGLVEPPLVPGEERRVGDHVGGKIVQAHVDDAPTQSAAHDEERVVRATLVGERDRALPRLVRRAAELLEPFLAGLESSRERTRSSKEIPRDRVGNEGVVPPGKGQDPVVRASATVPHRREERPVVFRERDAVQPLEFRDLLRPSWG